MNKAICCPFCQKHLANPTKFEQSVAWCPNVYICSTCGMRVLSWVIYASNSDNRKSILPLNWFQFAHLIDDLEKHLHQYKKEDPLILTEGEYEDYKDFYREDEGLELIYKIYEHREKIKNRSYN